MKLGILSDTHGFLDPEIPRLFEGVDHILHAGDIGLPWLILELQQVAPVTAVIGNTDEGLNYKETEVLELHGRKLLVHHVIELPTPADRIRRKIIRENPDIVVFGHTHQRHCETIGQTLYLNPGYAGRPKDQLARSVATVEIDSEGMTVDYLVL